MYFVFAGSHYYPGGGAEDCKYVAYSYDDALAYVQREVRYTRDWWHIARADGARLKIVEFGLKESKFEEEEDGESDSD